MSEHRFTFSEVIAATGAGEAWLRTALQRDKNGILGAKDKRMRRLLFSGSDVARIAVLHDLNADLKVAPAGAWEIVRAVEAFFGTKLAKGDLEMNQTMCASFSDDGEVLCWHVNDEGVIETFNDAAGERMFEVREASQRSHLTIPMARVFAVLASAVREVENVAK